MIFIINPISGGSRKQRLAKILQSRGYNVVFTEYAGHAEQLARETTEDVVVAVGGDGTVNEVARGIIGSNKSLGILPCGSGDGLARHLGLPHNFSRALSIIESGRCRMMDAAEVNGIKFFSVCGVGFDAEVSEQFAKSGRRGLFNYVKLGISTWLRYSPSRYTIEIDGATIHTEAMFITIGNSNQWGNEAKITPLADCFDGELDITVVDKFDIVELPKLAYQLMRGTLSRSSRVHCYRGKHIKISRSKEGAAHIDGDWFTAPQHLDIHILPAALRVIVP